ncbi:MAG: MarR family transcriptional regulator [Coriobacteriales bacterium]|nr:MarR family transcriptional regulator [Coriobacteriales bacterium]
MPAATTVHAATPYDVLKLDNQICFPLYAASREVIKRYKPHLDALDLTYTQYIAMMVLWEQHEVSARDLGQRLFLDSGTLTPVLKSLEAKGYVTRERSTTDERVLMVALTPAGEALRDRALHVPAAVGTCIELEPQEALQLHALLHKLLANFE